MKKPDGLREVDLEIPSWEPGETLSTEWSGSWAERWSRTSCLGGGWPFRWPAAALEPIWGSGTVLRLRRWRGPKSAAAQGPLKPLEEQEPHFTDKTLQPLWWADTVASTAQLNLLASCTVLGLVWHHYLQRRLSYHHPAWTLEQISA